MIDEIKRLVRLEDVRIEERNRKRFVGQAKKRLGDTSSTLWRSILRPFKPFNYASDRHILAYDF